MNVSAQHKNARMTPRKLSLLRSVVRGLPVGEAESQLRFMPGKASMIVLKVLRSAVANAEHNFALEKSTLTVRDLVIDAGFTMKRFNPVSKGMAHPILKRSSHVTVVVGNDQEIPAKKEQTARTKQGADQIETITATEHIRREVVASREATAKQETKRASGLLSTPKSKQQKASGKIIAGQQGGDAAKSHRRKSMSDS